MPWLPEAVAGSGRVTVDGVWGQPAWLQGGFDDSVAKKAQSIMISVGASLEV